VYTEHFRLREAPFRATPDPRFFYSNPVYREAYAALLYGVVERKGFIALTGEVGTGKTTLLRRLMDQLGPPVRFVFFYNTTLTFDETVQFICTELGLAVEGLSRVQRLQRLNDLLVAEATRGGNVVLLLDEAQNLGPDVLENLRLISNLETVTAKLLQIVLAGQPELDIKLRDPALRQVAQRIAVRARLTPLDAGEVERFIDYRLRRCGSSRAELFTKSAIRRVTVHSNGVPRLINILCDGALLTTYGANLRRVTGTTVDDVALYLGHAERRARQGGRLTAAGPRSRPAPRSRATRWAAATLLMLAATGTTLALVPGSPLVAARAGLTAPLFGGEAPPEVEPPPATARPLRPALAETPPAAAAFFSEGRTDGSRIVVEDGHKVSEVVSRRYGRHYLLGMDLVKDLNPHIADLDHVSAGETLWLPALTLDALVRRQPNGSYHLIVASHASPEAAHALARRIRDGGYRAQVATRAMTSTLRVHRVTLEGLEGPEAVRQTWTMAQKLGWTATVGDRGGRAPGDRIRS
jgi:type II secretory pathway predicted ATPase ExeA